MQLTDDLKDRNENAQSSKEAKAISADVKERAGKVGVSLDDEALDAVAGGFVFEEEWDESTFG